MHRRVGELFGSLCLTLQVTSAFDLVGAVPE